MQWRTLYQKTTVKFCNLKLMALIFFKGVSTMCERSHKLCKRKGILFQKLFEPTLRKKLKQKLKQNKSLSPSGKWLFCFLFIKYLFGLIWHKTLLKYFFWAWLSFYDCQPHFILHLCTSSLVVVNFEASATASRFQHGSCLFKLIRVELNSEW